MNRNKGALKRPSKQIFLLVAVLAFAFPFLWFFTGLPELFVPGSNMYTLAVESDGKLYEVGFFGTYLSAVNRKGEFLVYFNESDLNLLLTLFLDSGSLKLSGSSNPYFSGKVDTNWNSYKFVDSETVYDSPTATHTEYTFRDLSERTLWTYNPAKDEYPKEYFDRVSWESSGFLRKYFNFSRFVQNNYGIAVELEFDRKNELVIFKIPLGLAKPDLE